ncbi:conserved hypothetical protein 374 [Rubrobacter xylanophilus DSM 9941]|uniref:Flippase-like domain-containing protein n=1 Tax=Rubrobacter xylanophilus (strain DSM 9941 / JCM 11954 / NBRC 16129 / PRD-1) TaxID=266117 RepID=Q1ATH3_RUBXD|nr:TIGR00374 family protein [Rubrobacter xylanophilus]ABG05305.1 conserved hypothetical protein 374 [Rubrobacter xylanophilus DSM 9941]
MRGALLRNLLFLLSLGLALHLLLPRIPGVERSLELVSRASVPLILAALAAELLSELSYAGLLGRVTAAAANIPPRLRRRRGLGSWYMLRLTVTGYGASHALPGGGAAGAAVAYTALRSRGLERRRIGAALAATSALAYGALGTILAASLLYLLARGNLDPAQRTAASLGLSLTLAGFAGSYAVYRNPLPARLALEGAAKGLPGLLGGSARGRRLAAALERALLRLGAELGALRRQLMSAPPAEILRLCALALGFWAFDALCLLLMFRAFGVEVGTAELLAAYGIATAAGALPLTPGGIGVFETTILTVLVLFGIGPEATVPVLGYRLFNFWLPIPLAALLYPTLHRRPGPRPPLSRFGRRYS